MSGKLQCKYFSCRQDRATLRSGLSGIQALRKGSVCEDAVFFATFLETKAKNLGV